ncbi:prominin-1-A isoform X1 [Nematostella vectensis]|uniref:prominin-1-A isoform X1 n=1 Tax=Nematostella vectensis TaxID=45351 RepID=UPI0020772420|nr:prominin-1-A isoform X1 [Nematostella vectensis]XP_048584542.1 prominin-1-A isoform X1 [Nematostella vectensis]
MVTQEVSRWILLLACIVGLFTAAKAANTVNGSKINWDIPKEEEWKSNINLKFDDRGLQPWYDLSVSFINTVLNKDPYEIMREVISENKPLTEDPVNRFVTGYALGVVICAGIGVLFMLIMPIVGFCFCCCRCCNNCGGEMSQKDLPGNACKRSVFGVILSIITLLMFAGVLLMFVCNDNMSHSVGNSKSTIDGIVNEAVGFVNKTFNEFDNVVDKDFKTAVDQLSYDISDAGVKEHLGDPLLAVLESAILKPIEAVATLSQNTKAMENQLVVIVNNTNDLKKMGTTLSSDLQVARDNLTDILNDCKNTSDPSICGDINTNELKQDANFSAVDNVQSQLDNIREVSELDFEKAAKEGLQTVRDIPITMINKTSGPRNDIIKMIANATTQVKKILTDGRKTVDDGVLQQLKNIQSDSNYYTDLVKQYDKYRWYAGVGAACLFLLIVVMMALGLMCGICGYDKEATPTTRGSVSNMGGNCLMAAVGFAFIFSWFFMLVTTICFLIGSPLQRIVCEPIQSNTIWKEVIDNPASYKTGELPLSGILGGNKSVSIKAGEVLSNCRQNMPAYKALKIESLFNISEQFDIKRLLGETIDKELDNLKVNLTDQKILNNDSRQSLKKLNESGVDDINFDSFLNQTRKGITKSNLTIFAAQLDELAKNFSRAGDDQSGGPATKLYELGNRTEEIAKDLRDLDKNTAQQMRTKADDIEKNVNDLKAIGGDLSNAAVNALNEAEKAEQYLYYSAGPDIATTVAKFAARVLGWGYQFTDHVLNLVENNIGKCKPLTNIFDGTVMYMCNDLLYPFNGFWLSMGFCLFFFIPSIIFSVKLAKHYRCMKYESDFDQEGMAGMEAFEMAQPPPYNDVGQEKKLWANPKNSVYPKAPSAPPQY